MTNLNEIYTLEVIEKLKEKENKQLNRALVIGFAAIVIPITFIFAYVGMQFENSASKHSWECLHWWIFTKKFLYVGVQNNGYKSYL